MNTPTVVPAATHRLCFSPIPPAAGGARTFRCDAGGHVDLDALDRRERLEYLYARAMVGRDFGPPSVVDPAESGR